MIHIISADSTGRLFTVYQFLQFDFENIVRLIKINHFINMSIVSKYTRISPKSWPATVFFGEGDGHSVPRGVLERSECDNGINGANFCTGWRIKKWTISFFLHTTCIPHTHWKFLQHIYSSQTLTKMLFNMFILRCDNWSQSLLVSEDVQLPEQSNLSDVNMFICDVTNDATKNI